MPEQRRNWITKNFPERSIAAWIWLYTWTLQAFVLGLYAYYNSAGWIPAFEGWDTRSSIQLIELVLLLAISWLMHRTDEPFNARGFKQLYRYLPPASRFSVKEGAIRGLLTVLSIRSALTLGTLIALLNNRKDLLPENAHVTWHSFWHNPPVTFYTFAVSGFSLSLLLTLAAIQCFDYGIRFTWDDSNATEVTTSFVKKAHQLGVKGFYCLIWSLIAAAAIIEQMAGLAATTVVFVLFWYYYFFPPNTGNLLLVDHLKEAGYCNVRVPKS